MATTRKTTLACDRCRHRKSRCDGTRPSCGHCVAAGADCSYRPTPTNLETDVSVLSRLSDVEIRVRALEGGAAATTTAPLGQAALRPPVLHTASGHLMLHSWPRVRVCLPPGFEPLGFLLEAQEAAGSSLEEGPSESLEGMRGWIFARTGADFYEWAPGLPAPIAHLLEAYEGLSREKVLGDFLRADPHRLIEPRELSIAQLIVFSMALKNWRGSGAEGSQQVAAATAAASVCLRHAMERQWTLLSATADRVVLTLATAYSLVYCWSRPSQALGLLESVNSTIKRWSVRRPDDSLLRSCYKLYFILQSDILTEMDEYGCDTVLSGGDSAVAEVLPSELADCQTSTGQNDHQPSAGAYVDNHLWLRGHLNRVLHLYTPNKAYARPHELADLVAGLYSELRRWYHNQPLNRQFARDATTFNMNNSSLTLHDRELAIRYFSCVFFIHRPVLYFFLHRDMEYSIQPPNLDGAASDHDPWVLESCRDCIESAALIIQFCGLSTRNQPENGFRSWCEYQLLFATYLVILQAKGLIVFEPVFRNIGSAEMLLDLAEHVFESTHNVPLILHQSLVVLRDVRQTFDASSPQHSR